MRQTIEVSLSNRHLSSSVRAVFRLFFDPGQHFPAVARLSPPDTMHPIQSAAFGRSAGSAPLRSRPREHEQHAYTLPFRFYQGRRTRKARIDCRSVPPLPDCAVPVTISLIPRQIAAPVQFQ